MRCIRKGTVVMGNPLSDAGGDVLCAARDQRAISNRILAAWQRCPSLRLGQFIANAITAAGFKPAPDPFYIEDLALAEACDAFAEKHRTRR